MEVPVGYYTHVAGLGMKPSDVTFTSAKGVYSEEGDYTIGGALSTFWRSAENFRTLASYNWGVGTGMMWAVSQACRSQIVALLPLNAHIIPLFFKMAQKSGFEMSFFCYKQKNGSAAPLGAGGPIRAIGTRLESRCCNKEA